VILKPWTRYGTDSFLGQAILPGAEMNQLSGSLSCLDPDDGSAGG